MDGSESGVHGFVRDLRSSGVDGNPFSLVQSTVVFFAFVTNVPVFVVGSKNVDWVSLGVNISGSHGSLASLVSFDPSPHWNMVPLTPM